jgi:hypothetical protein
MPTTTNPMMVRDIKSLERGLAGQLRVSLPDAK